MQAPCFIHFFLIEKYDRIFKRNNNNLVEETKRKNITSFNIFKHVYYINRKDCDGVPVAQTHCNIFPQFG